MSGTGSNTWPNPSRSIIIVYCLLTFAACSTNTTLNTVSLSMCETPTDRHRGTFALPRVDVLLPSCCRRDSVILCTDGTGQSIRLNTFRFWTITLWTPRSFGNLFNCCWRLGSCIVLQTPINFWTDVRLSDPSFRSDFAIWHNDDREMSVSKIRNFVVPVAFLIFGKMLGPFKL